MKTGLGLGMVEGRRLEEFVECIFTDLDDHFSHCNISVWIKYAKWEESQKDFTRARAVWERELEVDYWNHTLWLKYAEVEMKNKFINHARYAECTASAIQALVLFRKLHPGYKGKEVVLSITGAANFIEATQKPAGSWYGNWGIF